MKNSNVAKEGKNKETMKSVRLQLGWVFVIF